MRGKKMLKNKFKEIQEFCIKNSDPAIVAKYSKYFKDGYNGYGIEDNIFKAQKDKWLEAWKDEMTITDYLNLGDKLVKSGKFEEVSFAIHFIAAQRDQYSLEVFDRIGKWLDIGISNWASTDVLCMLVLPNFIIDKIIKPEKFKEWIPSTSIWKRRAVPVTFVQMVRKGFKPKLILPIIEPLMLDKAEDVQKGLGTLVRELWKKYPNEIEKFLLKWKNDCGRLIIRYATEKMDKESKKLFKKS
jgi:3-methyladenine DNA glycosylase AlkD